jgi:hypothetical protein
VGGPMPLQYFFYLTIGYFGYCVEQGQRKKQKCFQNDYLGGVKKKKDINQSLPYFLT